MPGVDGYDPGATFIFRMFKRKTTNPSLVWSNTYEVVAYEGGGVQDLRQLETVILHFEQALHMTSTEFVRCAVSTWSADSRPYNPQAFLVDDLTGIVATRAELGGGPQPLNITWGIKRAAQTGRSGKLFFRNALTMQEVTAPAGVIAFANVVTMADLLTDAMETSLLGEYFGATPAHGLGMALIGRVKLPEGGTRITTMPIAGMVSWSPVDVQMDHKYYDLPEPTP